MTAAENTVALDGRALGKRGAATRRRLLDATGELLESNGLRDLRVVDIARAVGTSPATFYQYFRDVEEAVLALAEAVGEQTAPLVRAPRRAVDAATPGLESARRLVDGFLLYWDEHRAVLRTRNLAAQEGDQRFRDVRNASLQPITEGLSRKVAENGVAGLAPYAAAAALVAMMERMAAFHVDLEPYGATRADVVETTARIVFQTVDRLRPRPWPAQPLGWAVSSSSRSKTFSNSSRLRRAPQSSSSGSPVGLQPEQHERRADPRGDAGRRPACGCGRARRRSGAARRAGGRARAARRRARRRGRRSPSARRGGASARAR